MRLSRSTRRKPVGLTSLIDVIFLLLLFFMLTSSFTRYQAMPVANGGEGGGAEIKPAYFRIHDSNRMDLNGQSAARENLPQLFATLAAGEKALLAIWSGPEAKVQDVVDVMSAARREGLNTVIVTGK